MAYYMIMAPTMGMVSMLFVKNEAHVTPGQRVVGLEVMKMLTEVRTQFEGKIEFCVKLGQVVNKDSLLAKVHQT